MAFRFTLDAVLRFRESVEHSEEAVLLRIVQQIVETEQQLDQVEAEQIRIRESSGSKIWRSSFRVFISWTLRCGNWN